MEKKLFKIAAVQAAPVLLNAAATVDRACELIAEASQAGASIIVFPEAFVPGYPHWVWNVPPKEERLLSDLYAVLLENAVTVPGAITERLGRAAREAGAYVIMGVSERNTGASNTSLFNTLLYFDPTGNLMGSHRKLVPTGAERQVWAQGNGSILRTFETEFGKLGGLICWENYMPLARYAMYSQQIQLYLAPTWDSGEPWLSTLRHIAKEGGVYVIGCCIAMRAEDVPETFDYKRRYLQGVSGWINPGDSVIVNPEGNIIAGPAHETQTILYAEVDPACLARSKWLLDVAGHYDRPDVFKLRVNYEIS